MATNIKVSTGNRTVVMLEGKQVGSIKSLRANDDCTPEPDNGIGYIHATEYVAPTVVRLQKLVLYTDKLRQLGISLENGEEALKEVVLDLITMDKNGEVLRKSEPTDPGVLAGAIVECDALRVEFQASPDIPAKN